MIEQKLRLVQGGGGRTDKRSTERRRIQVPGQIAWKDGRGQTRIAAVVTADVSEHGVTDISFTAPRDHLEAAQSVTDTLATKIGATGVTTDDGIARVSLVGAGMKSNPGVAATMFETLAGAGINIEMISTSAIRLSCVVAESEVERAVQALHTAFGLDSTPE